MRSRAVKTLVYFSCALLAFGGCTRTYTVKKDALQTAHDKGADYVPVNVPGGRETYAYREAIISQWPIPDEEELLAIELQDRPRTLEAVGIGLTLGGAIMLTTGALLLSVGSNIDPSSGGDTSDTLGTTFLGIGIASLLGAGACLLISPYIEGPHPYGYDPLGPPKGLGVLSPR